MRAHKSCYVDAQRANSQCRPGGSEVLCEKVRLILRLWSKNGSVRWPLSHVELILAMNQPMLSARPKFVKDAQDALTAVVGGQNSVPALTGQVLRSEERRVGKECVSTCRSRWSPYH